MKENKTKYKIMPFNKNVTINEDIITHMFNWVMNDRCVRGIDTGRVSLGNLTHAEIQNWKVQLIEDMLMGTINFKDDE